LKAKEIINILNSFADPKLIDSWDNTGFQIGNDELDVKRILIALDLDDPVLEKAIKEDYQMIITHHPIIFNPLKSITNKTYQGRLILKLISNDIVAYNAHSNLDLAIGGVNDELARILNIKNTEPLSELLIEGQTYGYGRTGSIEEILAKEFIYRIKEILEINDVKVYGNIDKNISKVSVCGGSGGDFILDSYKKGAHAYITGDIKYHEAQLGLQLGMIIIDVGHFHSEKVILAKIKEFLIDSFKEDMYIEVYKETTVLYEIF